MLKMLNFILCIFYYNKKSQFLMIKKKKEGDGVQMELDIGLHGLKKIHSTGRTIMSTVDAPG